MRIIPRVSSGMAVMDFFVLIGLPECMGSKRPSEMARQPNPNNGRTSLDLPPKTKALLLSLCQQEDKGMAQVIAAALPLYAQWREQERAQAERSQAEFVHLNGREYGHEKS